jgi:predicted phage-related endonuclease
MRVGTLAHIDHPWMMASLDRLVIECPDDGGVCGLEIKTRNAFVAGKWREEVPDDVLAQVTWQLMVSGLRHIHVACLLGGQRMQQYVVARDKQLEDYLMAAAEPVWACIKTHTPPEVEADAEGVLLDELNKMFADRSGTVVVDPIEGARLQAAYYEGGRMENTGKAIKAVAKTEMVKLLGGAEVAVSKDNELQALWTYKRPDPAEEITAPNLKRLRREHPRVYRRLVADGFITKTSNKPRINVK